MNETLAFGLAAAAVSVFLVTVSVLMGKALKRHREDLESVQGALRHEAEVAERVATLAQHQERSATCICVVCRQNRGTWRAAR